MKHTTKDDLIKLALELKAIEVAKEEFKIKDVGTANWAIEKCTKQNESFEFYKKSVKSEIERLNTELKEEEQRTKDRNSYLLYLVEQYINEQNIPTKEQVDALNDLALSFIKKGEK